MRLKGITYEDFSNYKKPSMFIIFPKCSLKCDKESGVHCCQNSELVRRHSTDIPVDAIISHYMENPITQAIVCGGLEPFDTWDDLLELVTKLREKTEDEIVIYTGFYREEIVKEIDVLSQFKNIIIKFGRFIPNRPSRFDEVLGIKLASDNQYAVRL